jgi:hypothetical protein
MLEKDLGEFTRGISIQIELMSVPSGEVVDVDKLLEECIIAKWLNLIRAGGHPFKFKGPLKLS